MSDPKKESLQNCPPYIKTQETDEITNIEKNIINSPEKDIAIIPTIKIKNFNILKFSKKKHNQNHGNVPSQL